MRHSVVGISLVVALFTGLCCFSPPAQARDTRHRIPIAEVMEKYADQLEGIEFYFGDQAHDEPDRTMGEYQSNKKTNAFNKTDREACEWVFLSAMLSLKKRAEKEGGNAVIGIWSNYKKNKFVSSDEFECGAGALMAGVTLKGTVAELP